MAEPYVYVIDVSNYDGKWRNDALAECRQTLEDRDPTELAHAIMVNWIVDHPGEMAGGERMVDFGEDATQYPPDEISHVRVWIYRGSLNDMDTVPAAAAYLIDDPDE